MSEWLDNNPVRVKSYLAIVVGALLTFLTVYQRESDWLTATIATLTWLVPILGVETSVRGNYAAYGPKTVEQIEQHGNLVYAELDKVLGDSDPTDFVHRDQVAAYKTDPRELYPDQA